MALFSKKKSADDDNPPIPDMNMDELPPLPPLPGEEDLGALPEPMPRGRRQQAPVMPDFSMDAPMREVRPAMMSQPTISDRATVFIKIDKYRDIMRTISDMENKIEELKTTLDKISSIKGREAEIIDGWNAMLQDTKSKLDEVHSKLTKPEA